MHCDPKRQGQKKSAVVRWGICALSAALALVWMMPPVQANEITQSPSEFRVAPLMRGTLWWVTPADPKVWTEERIRESIDAQCAVGFDILWLLNTPRLLRTARDDADILRRIFVLADARNMKVIVDLPVGGWYGKTSLAEMTAAIAAHAAAMVERYGRHASLWGWYINHEINPIAPGDIEEGAFWRAVWKQAVQDCHAARPGSVVTISPFFLLDKARRRGFVYLTPEQYAAWWGETLRETGIDILMLQDSGEHLSFFTLEQREPFFVAVARACREAGAQFWVNVETGEAHVRDWDEYLLHYGEKNAPWRFTPMDWLEQKLQLAARYADGIINWGYFPFMNPHPIPGEERPGLREAYEAYRDYYLRVKETQQKEE